MTYPTLIITTSVTKWEMHFWIMWKEKVQSQTDWSSNTRPTAHKLRDPEQGSRHPGFGIILWITNPAVRYERGRLGVEDGDLGDSSYRKASEKVLPQTPNTSRWRQTSIIHRPRRGPGGRWEVIGGERERQKHRGVWQTWEQEKPLTKQRYWLESTASNGQAAAAIAGSIEEGGPVGRVLQGLGQRSPLLFLVWQNVRSVRDPHRQRLCGVHAVSSIPQFSWTTLMPKIGVFRRLGGKGSNFLWDQGSCPPATTRCRLKMARVPWMLYEVKEPSTLSLSKIYELLQHWLAPGPGCPAVLSGSLLTEEKLRL